MAKTVKDKDLKFMSCTHEYMEYIINRSYKKDIEPWHLDFESIIAIYNSIKLDDITVVECDVDYELQDGDPNYGYHGEHKVYIVNKVFMTYKDKSTE